MIRQHRTFKHSLGFSLLEILIAVVVLSVGLLAVARFQSGLVASSGYSKARAEAMTLAQEKIDELRSYADEDELISNLSQGAVTSGTFPADPSGTNYHDYDIDTATTGGGINDPYPGNNADFGRDWTLTTDGQASRVNVTVNWFDNKSNSEETVTLSTIVSWANPELAALLANEDFEPLVDSPSGRASYTNETVTFGDNTIAGDGDNNDGTYTFQAAGETDIKLIDVSGKVLLSLEDACNSNAGGFVGCTDFVKIRGTVYLEDGGADPENVFLAASDAAYCAKDASGNVSGHSFFDYACYLGGAYYGNLGIIEDSGGVANSLHKVCVGDKRSSGHTNPAIQSSRRVYRGMLTVDYTTALDTLDGDPTTDSLTDGIADDANGLPRYVSIGIHDALELANVNDPRVNSLYGSSSLYAGTGVEEDYLPGHNFLVVTETGAGTTLTRDECITKLTAVPNITVENIATSAVDDNPEVSVHPFDNTPDDFFCLNEVVTYTDASGDVRYQEFYDDEFARAPFYDNDQDPGDESEWVNDSTGFTMPNTYDASTNVRVITGCPFNPSNPPSEFITITGSLYLGAADASGNFTTSPSDAAGMVINTSDDLTPGTVGNCTVSLRSAIGSATRGDGTTDASPDTMMFADYSCDAYHNFDDKGTTATNDDVGSGWSGTILITPANNYSCTPASYSVDNAKVGSPANYEWFTENKGTQTGAPDYEDDLLPLPGNAGLTLGLDFECNASGLTDADLVTTVALAPSSTDASPLEGANVIFRVTTTNNGPLDEGTVTVSVPTPTGLTYLSYIASSSPSGGSFSGGTWTISSIAVGDSPYVDLTYAVNSGQVGTLANTTPTSPITLTAGAAVGQETDPGTTGDSLTVDIIPTTSGTANLVTVKTLSGATDTVVGDTVVYNVTVTNLGGGDVGTVIVKDTFPSELTFITPTAADIGTDSAGSPNLFSGPIGADYTWTIPLLNADDSATLLISGTVNAAASPITNTVTEGASGSLVDPSTINDVLSDSSLSSITVAANEHDLVTTIVVDDETPTEGDTITFTITMTNNGPQNTSSASTTVDLDTTNDVTGLTLFSSASANPWTDGTGTFNESTGVWSGITLNSGDSTTLVLKATADNDGIAASPITVSTSLPTAVKDDPTTVGDVLTTNNISVSVAGVTYTPATISGTLDKSAASGASKLSAVTIQLVDLSYMPTGSVTACSILTGGSSYSCSINFDSLQHTGAILQVTPNGSDVACNDAKLVSSVVTSESTASSATYTWILNIGGVTTTKVVTIADVVGNCP